ncbi:MAG: HlyD family efflux transporter periplasmic adaptor subunit [Hyphomicrobiaceae bacterium]
MSQTSTGNERPQAPLDAGHVVLPKQVVDRSGVIGLDTSNGWSIWSALRVARFVPLIMGLVMLGGFIGLYFQPPGLQKLFALLKLQPGGGTSTPIAVPARPSPSKSDVTAKASGARHVVGLGKLVPLGDIVTVAPPFGSGDARIATMSVKEGDLIEKDAMIATLDNEPTLKAAVLSARASVNAREAALVQTRAAVRASRDEARAAWDRAKVTVANAEREFERVDALFKRGVSTSVSVDQKRATRDEANREVERTKATLSRFDTIDPEQQPDVVVAARTLDSTKADLTRIERELEKAYVRAPRSGTVLTVHVRAGEKPGTKGILNLGDIDHMTAEVEIYQTQIGSVGIGDAVDVTAEALSKPLKGTVSRIGLEVARQTSIDPSPAASTDARVVKVDVTLDPESAALAKRFTNLQVTARITIKDRP